MATPEEEKKIKQALKAEAIKTPAKPDDKKLKDILKRANKK